MLGDKVFRIALLISITAHSAILMPRLHLDSIFKTLETDESKYIEISYLEIKPEPKLIIEEKPVLASQIEPVTTESEKENRIEEKELKVEKIEEENIPVAAKKESVTETVELEPEKPKVELGPIQQRPSYINYYNMIREKIKYTLSKMYKSRFSRGEIYLEFTLRSDGVLDKVDIIDEKSTPSPVLRELTLKALQKSSPFPPFPQELNEPQISFNVVVSFRQ